MTKGEQTRRGIVQKAAPLFNQKGFEGTSLSDLMRATGLQKGGIYRHFSQQGRSCKQSLRLFLGKSPSGRLEGIEELPDSVDRLKKMIDNFVHVRSGLVPGGCPLMNTAVESDDGNAVLRARAKKALQSWTTRLSQITSDGITKGHINLGVAPTKLSQLIIGSLEVHC